MTNCFRYTLPKQKSGIDVEVLWMFHELQHYCCIIICLNSFFRHDAFNSYSLSDVSNVSCRLKSFINDCCMKQYKYPCLKNKFNGVKLISGKNILKAHDVAIMQIMQGHFEY